MLLFYGPLCIMANIGKKDYFITWEHMAVYNHLFCGQVAPVCLWIAGCGSLSLWKRQISTLDAWWRQTALQHWPSSKEWMETFKSCRLTTTSTSRQLSRTQLSSICQITANSMLRSTAFLPVKRLGFSWITRQGNSSSSSSSESPIKRALVVYNKSFILGWILNIGLTISAAQILYL